MASRRTSSTVGGIRVGIDVGGTFTDFVFVLEGKLHTLKLPSDPRAPDEAVAAGLAAAGIGEAEAVIYGSTVATNALLERTGARAVLVTTEGFRDVLEIGRQMRPNLYAIEPRKPEPLIPRRRRLQVEERVAADGSVVRDLSAESLREVERSAGRLKPDSAAVSLLFSFLRPAHERAVRAALRRAGVRLVSISSEVLPEYREFERTATTVVDAYVAPVTAGAIRRLRQRVPGPLWIIQSNGGLLRADEAAARPVRTVLSGPAAGVVGALHAAQESGFGEIVTLDMGGTSTDVSLCPGEPLRTTEGMVAGTPIAIPMTEIHTVGAGGGSIAYRDEAGALRVGPRSAGADPGPACYGRGGIEPTVTDANLVLGRLAADAALGASVRLEPELAARAIDRLTSGDGGTRAARIEAASAVVTVANAHMERALRVITLERGFDPRDFVLIAFGGAGPMHACALAERLEIDAVLVPRFPGVLSALGALAGAHTRDYSVTLLRRGAALTTARLRAAFSDMAAAARRDFPARAGRELSRSIDMRYAGQSFEINVPYGPGGMRAATAEFHRRHERRYAHSRLDAPVEMVVARLRASVAQPPLPRVRARRGAAPAASGTTIAIDRGRRRRVPVFARDELPAGFQFHGPAIVVQPDATAWVPSEWSASVDASEALMLARQTAPG